MILNMKNISKEPSILKGQQMSFEDLMGDDMTFFNKDLDTPDIYGLRKSMLEHSETCMCLDCEEDKED